MKTLLTLAASSLLLFSIISGFIKNENTVSTVDVGVVVSDLKRALSFYTNVLGMEQTGTWHSSKEMSASYGVNSGKAFDIINLKLDCDGYILKYKLNYTPANITKDTSMNIENDNYGFENVGSRYLTINVKSIDPFIKRMKENHIKFKLVTLPDGYRVVLLKDPDGALLEIGSN